MRNGGRVVPAGALPCPQAAEVSTVEWVGGCHCNAAACVPKMAFSPHLAPRGNIVEEVFHGDGGATHCSNWLWPRWQHLTVLQHEPSIAQCVACYGFQRTTFLLKRLHFCPSGPQLQHGLCNAYCSREQRWLDEARISTLSLLCLPCKTPCTRAELPPSWW
jgi:hypothetical protein